MSLYKTPFSRAYWRDAVKSFRSLRGMVFAAMMIALCVVLSMSGAKIILSENLSFSPTFLPRALCALVYGPVGAILFAVAEDTLGFFLGSSSGPYFPGYTLTTVLGCLWYALFFYRAKVTVLRVTLAKLITNVQNVLLGSLWSAILYGKGYLYYMGKSAVKNAAFLPVQVVMLVVVLRLLLPILSHMGFIPNQLGEKGKMKVF